MPARGNLAKDTPNSAVRFAPPLIIAKAELAWAVEQVRAVLGELETTRIKKSA